MFPPFDQFFGYTNFESIEQIQIVQDVYCSFKG